MILKNTGVIDRIWAGQLVTAGGQYIIQERDRIVFLMNADFLTDLQNGVAVVNNGVRDLPYEYAVRALGSRQARATITTFHNGTVGNNQWLGYSEVIPGNQVPIRIPWDCDLHELSFSYAVSNLLGIPLSGEQIDGQFKLFKNGLTDPDNVIYTEQFTNQVGGKVVDELALPLQKGDWIVGRWADQGDNPSDMAIVYFFLLR